MNRQDSTDHTIVGDHTIVEDPSPEPREDLPNASPTEVADEAGSEATTHVHHFSTVTDVCEEPGCSRQRPDWLPLSEVRAGVTHDGRKERQHDGATRPTMSSTKKVLIGLVVAFALTHIVGRALTSGIENPDDVIVDVPSNGIVTEQNDSLSDF